mmetsp:Transcript_9850/g.29282  ORF Transcript_9850/g.29282 Transcript_9850/m.29282 type:complete len:103 (+) Transcript_9850:495-803(+)
MWWNAIYFGQIIKSFLVSVGWVVMNENATIPSSIEWAGTTVKAFAALIEKQVPTGQCDLVGNWKSSFRWKECKVPTIEDDRKEEQKMSLVRQKNIAQNPFAV